MAKETKRTNGSATGSGSTKADEKAAKAQAKAQAKVDAQKAADKEAKAQAKADATKAREEKAAERAQDKVDRQAAKDKRQEERAQAKEDRQAATEQKRQDKLDAKEAEANKVLAARTPEEVVGDAVALLLGPDATAKDANERMADLDLSRAKYIGGTKQGAVTIARIPWQLDVLNAVCGLLGLASVRQPGSVYTLYGNASDIQVGQRAITAICTECIVANEVVKEAYAKEHNGSFKGAPRLSWRVAYVATLVKRAGTVQRTQAKRISGKLARRAADALVAATPAPKEDPTNGEDTD